VFGHSGFRKADLFTALSGAGWKRDASFLWTGSTANLVGDRAMHGTAGIAPIWTSLVRSLALASVLFAIGSRTARADFCIADVNHDGAIVAEDLALLLADWGGPSTFGLGTDIDRDGIVDAADLTLLLGSWNDCTKVPAWADLIEPSPDPAVITDPALRAAIISSGSAWRVRDRASGVEMVLVPKGTYAMGASVGDALAVSDEHPRHVVSITRSFYLGRFEVTQPEFEGVMKFNPSYFLDTDGIDEAHRPVETVSHNMIAGFLAQTGLRLPTECEWEYACRAGTLMPNYGGEGEPLGDLAWFQPNSGFVTHPVGSRRANPLGLHDMLGNVWEWCSDWYGEYPTGSVTDPTGPGSGSYRVFRGGGWSFGAGFARSARRFRLVPGLRNFRLGFRPALSSVR